MGCIRDSSFFDYYFISFIFLINGLDESQTKLQVKEFYPYVGCSKLSAKMKNMKMWKKMKTIKIKKMRGIDFRNQ